MYRPKIFAEDRVEVLHDFIREYPLGLIITHDSVAGMAANLIPSSLNQIGEKGTLRFHLAKMNSQVESLRSGNEVLIVFTGPNAYVSASAYPNKKVDGKAVPTWNYSMVQVRGKAKVIDDPDWILKQINDLTDASESHIQGDWKVSDAPVDYIKSQLNILVGLEVEITSIEGKFKLSQNHNDENRAGVEEFFKQNQNFEMVELVKNGTKK